MKRGPSSTVKVMADVFARAYADTRSIEDSLEIVLALYRRRLGPVSSSLQREKRELRRRRLEETIDADRAAAMPIAARVASLCDVSLSLLVGGSRVAEVAHARWVVAAVLHRRWRWPLARIGRALYRGDHSSVIAALRSVDDRPDLLALVEQAVQSAREAA